MSGILYVVATPIGNLDDLSPRARQTLAEVDLVAAEDTRHTGRLLSHFGIKARLLALHEHNETEQVDGLIRELDAGRSVALVSDAGTPLISDPGFRVVRAAHASGIAVTPIPGPSALTAALSVSGLPTDRFCFEGFLPAKSKARCDRLAELRSEPRTLVFYESVHRVFDAIADLEESFGSDRPAFLARELTKMHEQCLSTTLGELRRQAAAGEIVQKGEIVLVVSGAADGPGSDIDVDKLLAGLAGKLPDKEIAAAVAAATGERRNALYQRLLELGSPREK